MKIISSFKEPYDHLAKNPTMSDALYVWNRKTTGIVDKDIPFLLPRIHHCGTMAWRHVKWTYDNHVVLTYLWFCGNKIPFVMHEVNDDKHFYYSETTIPDDTLKHMNKSLSWNCNNIVKEHFQGKYLEHEEMYSLKSRAVQKQNISINDMHRFFKSPVFMLDPNERLSGNKIIVNPNLIDIRLYNTISPYSAFTQLEMFLSSVLAPSDDPMILPVPDKIKAESHGFNKFSFRKDKSC